jgi:hypothetical protein
MSAHKIEVYKDSSGWSWRCGPCPDSSYGAVSGHHWDKESEAQYSANLHAGIIGELIHEFVDDGWDRVLCGELATKVLYYDSEKGITCTKCIERRSIKLSPQAQEYRDNHVKMLARARDIEATRSAIVKAAQKARYKRGPNAATIRIEGLKELDVALARLAALEKPS